MRPDASNKSTQVIYQECRSPDSGRVEAVMSLLAEEARGKTVRIKTVTRETTQNLFRECLSSDAGYKD